MSKVSKNIKSKQGFVCKLDKNCKKFKHDECAMIYFCINCPKQKK